MARVGLIMDNSIKYIELVVDIWNQNNSVVLMDWRIPAKETIILLKMAKVTRCYVDDAIWKEYTNIDKEIKFIPVDKQSIIAFLPNYIYERFRENTTQEEALILFSSGTTGRKKGIRLTHYAITRNAKSIMAYMQLEAGDKLYIMKSMSHASTIVGEILVGLLYKIPMLIAATETTIQNSLINIYTYGITVLCINPSIMYLLNKALPRFKNREGLNIRKIYTSGSISSIDETKKLKALLSDSCIYNVYGLSEAGPRVTAQREEYPLGSVGKPIEGVKIAVIDINGNELGSHQDGIIHVLTESRFSGYLSGTERQSYKEGWVNTGDIGYYDEGNNYYIKGRADDMILTGSHNVYPNHVENVILRHEMIEECLVFGIRDDALGEKIICFYCAKESLQKKEILNFCKKQLTTYELPRDFIQVHELPKTLNGKKSRKMARELYENI